MLRIDIRREAPPQTLAPAHPWVQARRIAALRANGGLPEHGLDLLLTLESPRFIDPPIEFEVPVTLSLVGAGRIEEGEPRWLTAICAPERKP